MPEQVLAGRRAFRAFSPMYHAIALEDVLDLVNVCPTSGRRRGAGGEPAHWREQVARLPCCTGWLHESSGWRDLFLQRCGSGYCGKFRDTCRLFRAAGYRSKRDGDKGACAHLAERLRTAGRQGNAWLCWMWHRIGPDYLPGHAHADTLVVRAFAVWGSGWWSIRGHRSIRLGAERLRERGTAAHSTVQVDGTRIQRGVGRFPCGAAGEAVRLAMTDDRTR